MSLPIPLTVRLVTSRRDIHVTRDLRGLTIREVVPGGFASCRISLDRPLSLQPGEIAYFGKVYVYDSRTGVTVWEGWLEDPGRGVAGDGQVWDLTAMGPSAHAQDRTIPIVYVDRNLNSWGRIPDTIKGMETVQDSDTNSDPGWRMQIRNGTVVAGSTNLGGIENLLTDRANQGIARISLVHDMGNSDPAWLMRMIIRADFGIGGGTTILDQSWSTTAAATTKVVGTDWTGAGQDNLQIQIRRTSGVTVTDDATWQLVTSVIVRAIMFGASGSELTAAADYTVDTVYAHEVVADLIGRLLNKFDGANASIATTSFAIEQLAYPDGITAHGVLADLMRFHPTFFWAAWESNSAGLHRFEWSEWPTKIRYEAAAADGYDGPSSGHDIYNAVRVRYKTPDGLISTVRRTQTVTALSDVGRTREAFIDLGDEVGGTVTNANRAGDQFLAEHATPRNAGRLTVARPVLDLLYGRMVQPWEIRAGTLIRVRGVLPRVDALNVTGRDGVTVFRVVARQYDAASATATLELDAWPLTTARIAGDLLRRPVLRRR